MMDVNNLFSFFLEGDDTEKEIIFTEDLTMTPPYWLGMFKKLIINHLTFNKKAIEMFGKSNKEFDIAEIEEAGGCITYQRAWFYINKIDLENQDHIEGMKKSSDIYLEKTLKQAIQHFQDGGESEDYRKCAHLLKILKKVQGFNLELGC